MVVPTPTLPLSKTAKPNWEELVFKVVKVKPVWVPNPLTVNAPVNGAEVLIPTLPVCGKILNEVLDEIDGVEPENVKALLFEDKVWEAKEGVAVVSMFWIVLITPDEAEKLVALKAAIPLVEPSAAASLMVMVEPPPVALAIDNTPDKPLSEVTPTPPAEVLSAEQ